MADADHPAAAPKVSKASLRVLAEMKPKIEPTSRLISPLYDKLEMAKLLIDCAYYATYHGDCDDSVADPMRAAMDEGLRHLREVREAMHDMIAWAK